MVRVHPNSRRSTNWGVSCRNAQLVEYDEKLIRSTSINAPVAVSMASPNTLYALQVNLKFKDVSFPQFIFAARILF